MSAIGTKQTSPLRRRMSAFGGKADIAQTFDNVRARCIDNPRKVLGPTALRPNRYSLQTKLRITPYGDTLRSRGLLG
jgi:hypothetical protein